MASMEEYSKGRKPMVEVRDLVKSFGDLLVLDAVTFDVFEGEFLCIVGPTGCGKTTFLNALSTLYEKNSGDILIEGKPVDLRVHDLAYVLQEPSTMDWLTVEENVRFGLNLKKIPKDVADERVDDVLRMVDLLDYRNYYPRQLSISMIQRVVIARAFVTHPQLLLMDEPYGQLDIELRFRLENELIELWKKTGTTCIFITHNIEEAVYLGERVMVLTDKPATIRENIIVDIPRPRDFADPEFIRIRNHVTEMIKWW
jgi:sulfonate transport system ATP-binding protein